MGRFLVGRFLMAMCVWVKGLARAAIFSFVLEARSCLGFPLNGKY